MVKSIKKRVLGIYLVVWTADTGRSLPSRSRNTEIVTAMTAASARRAVTKVAMLRVPLYCITVRQPIRLGDA